MWNGREAGDIQAVGDLVLQVEPKPRFMVNRKTGRASKPAAIGRIGGRDLLSRLLIVHGHHDLIGLDRRVVLLHASIRHVVAHQRER